MKTDEVQAAMQQIGQLAAHWAELISESMAEATKAFNEAVSDVPK